MWNLKSDKNAPIYKPETDSQTQRTDLQLPRWSRDREGKNLSMCKGPETGETPSTTTPKKSVKLEHTQVTGRAATDKTKGKAGSRGYRITAM